MTTDEIKTLLYTLHHTTYRNERQIQLSNECGCFHCLKTFPSKDVAKWCDNDNKGDRTALCPFCGVDSVLGDACGYTITPSLLNVMNIQFFGEGIDNLDITVRDVRNNRNL